MVSFPSSLVGSWGFHSYMRLFSFVVKDHLWVEALFHNCSLLGFVSLKALKGLSTQRLGYGMSPDTESIHLGYFQHILVVSVACLLCMWCITKFNGAMHCWGYTSLEVKGRWGLLLSLEMRLKEHRDATLFTVFHAHWCHTDVWHRQRRPGEHTKLWCPSH